MANASALPANSNGRATFSSAVMVGTRWNDWKTMPMLLPRMTASSSSLSPMKSCPATRTEPEVARSSPAMTIKSEVLPEPLGPTTATDFSGRDVDVDALEDLYRPGAAGQRQRNVVQGDDRFGHDRKRLPPGGLPRALQVSTSIPRTPILEMKREDIPCGRCHRRRRSQTWCFAVLLCNWLIAALAFGVAAAPAGQPLRIVVLGDSLVAGFGLKPSDAFPAQLERALKARGHAVEVINAGVSGDTTAGGLARVTWAVPEQTGAVILELGANDALRGLDPTRAKANLDKIITALKASGAEVLLAGMFAPRSLGKDYVRAFDGIYPDLAGKHGLILYPFFLEGVAMDARLNLDDGLHPNPRGVAEITKKILPSVEQLIERARAKQATGPKG